MLKGVRVEEAVEKAGLSHHHYPCLCSMEMEDDLQDTLMHVSGLEIKKAVDSEIAEYRRKRTSYLDPSQL